MIRAADPETSYSTAETRLSTAATQRGRAVARRHSSGSVDHRARERADTARVGRGQATVTLETSDAGDGAAVHRLRTDWSADSTWASLDGGVQADGSQAVADAVARTGAVATARFR